MNEAQGPNGFLLREAAGRDIPPLAAHHRRMFEEIWETKGRQIDGPAAMEMERGYARKLGEELPVGSCKAWLIEREGRIVASGAISMVSFVPTPMDPSAKVGYLHSMYTEAEWRGKGLAGRIVRAALECCRIHGIRRVLLSASDAGRPVYQGVGFLPYPEMMRIFLD